jgi:hypothetical protein
MLVDVTLADLCSSIHIECIVTLDPQPTVCFACVAVAYLEVD